MTSFLSPLAPECCPRLAGWPCKGARREGRRGGKPDDLLPLSFGTGVLPSPGWLPGRSKSSGTDWGRSGTAKIGTDPDLLALGFLAVIP